MRTLLTNLREWYLFYKERSTTLPTKTYNEMHIEYCKGVIDGIKICVSEMEKLKLIDKLERENFFQN